jgi:histidinol-phosphate/aromatic aminotransferase/cobyric acid decarboxylase-like protein
MSFPLAEWIDGHPHCRHNLAVSGMIRSIPSPVPSAADVRRARPEELRRRLSDDLGVDDRRVFLTTGASQANALVLLFLARNRRGTSSRACRVCLPEYPPLFDDAQWVGFRLTEGAEPAELALVSQPRNPEGDLWDRARFLEWAADARSVLVDETFREFAGSRTLLGTGRPRLWATGSFTKFFAGDDLRVGFLVAPEESADAFARFHGLMTNLLPSYSVAGALRALEDRETIRRRVAQIVGRNVTAAKAAFPRVRPPKGPVLFDRPESEETGDSLARRAVAKSVLVCSGSFFGDPSGVRLCLTRKSFPEDLRAYLAVRDRGHRARAGGTVGRPSVRGRAVVARRPPGGSGRARAGPS